MIKVSNHLLRTVFRFHYHTQKVIGSLGVSKWGYYNLLINGIYEGCTNFLGHPSNPNSGLNIVSWDVFFMVNPPQMPPLVARKRIRSTANGIICQDWLIYSPFAWSKGWHEGVHPLKQTWNPKIGGLGRCFGYFPFGAILR